MDHHTMEWKLLGTPILFILPPPSPPPALSMGTLFCASIKNTQQALSWSADALAHLLIAFVKSASLLDEGLYIYF